MDLALKSANLGNKNAITDAGSAVNLAYAALTSAAYNVRINLTDLEDQKKKSELLAEITQVEEQGQESLAGIKTILTDRGGLF